MASNPVVSRPADTLQMLESWGADVALLSSAIRDIPRAPLNILEAGCGRKWPLDLKGLEYRLTGIDLDAAALESRVREVGDLDDAIVGDICAPGTIQANSYDVIYSSFVLEHLENAEFALEEMVRGLKVGGLFLLRIPDRDSVYGWTARSTPFSVHIAYYKFVLGLKNAGKPGFAPYRTYHAPIVSRNGIREFCSTHACEILHEYGHSYYLHEGGGLRSIATRCYAMSLSAISLNSLAWKHNNLTYVLRRS